ATLNLAWISARDAASQRWTLMKVAVVELGQLRKLRFVEHHHAPAADIDDFRLAQLPDDAIGVDRRDPQCLCNLFLRERHFKCITRRTADDGKAVAQLQDGVGEPAIRRSLADIDDPLPEYRRIDQRVAPELFRDVRPGARQG